MPNHELLEKIRIKWKKKHNQTVERIIEIKNFDILQNKKD